jgi:hypothetical protein
MPHRNDFTGIGNDGIGIKMRFNPLIRLRTNLPAQLLSGLVVEIDDPASTMIVRLMPEIEQTLNDIGRNASLLKPYLGMTGHGQHVRDSFNGNDAMDVTEPEAHHMRQPKPLVAQKIDVARQAKIARLG